MIETLETPSGIRWNINHCFEGMKKFPPESKEYQMFENILGFILNRYRRQQKAEMYSEVLVKDLVRKAKLI